MKQNRMTYTRKNLTIYFKHSRVTDGKADGWLMDAPSPHEQGRGLLSSATGQHQAVRKGWKKSWME